MGNSLSEQRYALLPRPATLSEVLSRPCTEKLEAYGATRLKALTGLKEICNRKQHLPKITSVPNEHDVHYCGHFEIKICTRKETVYNTVFFQEPKDMPGMSKAMVWI